MPWIESFVGAAFGATSVAGALGYVGKHLLDHSLKREEQLLKSKLSEIAAINKELRDGKRTYVWWSNDIHGWFCFLRQTFRIGSGILAERPDRCGNFFSMAREASQNTLRGP